MSRPLIDVRCGADQYANKNCERIIEFLDPETGKGGLISFKRMEDNTLRVNLYRLDEGVVVINSEGRFL